MTDNALRGAILAGHMEGNRMDYLDREGEHLAAMRLTIEGAADLFETDAQPLFRLAIQNDALTACVAFDTIGTALSDLRTRIRTLQQEHMEEAARQMKA